MSNKALGLTSTELELTQRMQTHFPRGLSPEVLHHWNSCQKEVLTKALARVFGQTSLEHFADTVLRLRASGYLDTSFEGKESHSLEIKPITKDEALFAYRQSGGKTWIWDELEQNMPYMTPKAEHLDVMIMNFGKNISSDDAIAEMDKLGVRPLTYEELIQYGIMHPEHQKSKWLIGLGTKHVLGGRPRAPCLGFVVGERGLRANRWGNVWDDECRFPVVHK